MYLRVGHTIEGRTPVIPLTLLVLAIVLRDRGRQSASVVALVQQCDSLDQGIIEAPLPPGASDFSVRALDTTPAREPLMFLIIRNATVPVGCVSDFSRFECEVRPRTPSSDP